MSADDTSQASTGGRADMRLTSAAGVAVVVAWLLLQLPMDVPDASTPTVSSYVGSVDDSNSIAQTFVPERNNLDSISLVLSTEESSDTPSMTFKLYDGGPAGLLIRTVKVPIASLPEGDAYKYRPGSLDERWTTIHFDPLPDSAGRPLYFELDGSYVPAQNRVRTLLMFSSKYPQGAAFVNGEARNANVVFRTQSRSQVKGYLWTIARNLTAGKPGVLSNPATYMALGTAYLLLLVVLLSWIRRVRTD